MKVSVKQLYTSVACNRIPEILDWSPQGFICFGATNAVVLYDTNLKGSNPLTVLHHHHSQVNSVKWLRKPDGTCREFVSCSADKTAAIWSLVDGHWTVTSKLSGHTEGITCIHGIYTAGDDAVVFTGSIDSTVRVWERTNGITIDKQIINLNTGLCLTLYSHLFPIVNKPVLFCALDDHKIHIFAGEEYHRVHTLVGHEDWVRGLDGLDVDDQTILLASASQDTYIRLWRIHLHEEESGPGIRVEQKVFPAYKQLWGVKLDAVLAGHEGWVYGVQWHPWVYDKDTNKKLPVYRLLSSSLDKTLIIWEPDAPTSGQGDGGASGAWVERVRVGEVGGNGLGFYGSRFGPNGERFVGHGYNGSFHIWSLNKDNNQWEPSVVCGGHFGAVEDVRWGAGGRYVLSVSADQTSRVHAPWVRPDGLGVEWHEVSRPQVHGYDMSSVALVSATTFASAAEEKVVRVFTAPNNFTHNFKNITGEELGDATGGPEGASVPSLGLSNKAVFTGDDSKSDLEDDADEYFVPVNLTEPPTEETLMQNTLWPEVHKLYGHGYEVFALDASADGQLLASACKATTSQHAAILLWETTSWQQIQKLECHSLTVTQLAFSLDSRRLLSVSRDRKWYLFRRREGSDPGQTPNLFDVEAYTDKSNGVHSRIIWCCAWAHDGGTFGTGSRDGKVCLWSKTQTQSESSLGSYALLNKPLDLGSASVTALAFAPPLDGVSVVAVGLDSGIVRLYTHSDGWSLIRELDHSDAHHLTVKRLTFKRCLEENGSEVLLASCGADSFVRIYSVTVAS